VKTKWQDIVNAQSDLHSATKCCNVTPATKIYRHVFQVTLFRDSKLTPWSWALIQKPPFGHILKISPKFYGSRRFITVFTWALHWSLSWARSIQSIRPHPFSLRSLSHQNPIFIPLRPHSYYILFPSHPPSLNHSNFSSWRIQVISWWLHIQMLHAFGFEVFMLVTMKTTSVLDVTPCSLAESHPSVRRTYFYHFQGRRLSQ
jgi:hypothetical protein